MATSNHGDRVAGLQPGDETDLDSQVRAVLEPPPHTAARIVATALRAGSEPSLSVLGLPRRPFLAAGLLLAGIVLAAVMWPRSQQPPSSSRGVMTNVGDIIVIKMPDRPITLIAPGADISPVPAGTVSIVLLGETP